MTVYHKVVKTKTTQDELNKIIRGSGIDCLYLGESAGIDQITVEFVCSDNNPMQQRTMKDIDNLLMKLKDVKEVADHRNEPKTSKHLNHLLQISVDKNSDIGLPGKEQGETKEIERG